jgi:hypothetical protein
MQGGQFAAPQQVMLGAVPKEGPLAVPYTLDFTTQTQYLADLTAQQQQAKISMVQTIYVDNSLASVPLICVMSNSNQIIRVAPFSQAYIPVVLTNKLAIAFSSTSGLVIPAMLMNIAMNAYQWQSNGAPSYNGSGALLVSDPALEAAVVSGYIQSREFYTAGDGSIVANYAGTKTIQGLLTTTAAATLITGAPGWMLKTLTVAAMPNTTLAAAGILTATLAESGGSTIAVGDVFAPTAVPTGLTARQLMINLDNVNISSKIGTSNLTLQLSAATVTGGVRYNATFAQTAFVGG